VSVRIIACGVFLRALSHLDVVGIAKLLPDTQWLINVFCIKTHHVRNLHAFLHTALQHKLSTFLAQCLMFCLQGRLTSHLPKELSHVR